MSEKILPLNAASIERDDCGYRVVWGKRILRTPSGDVLSLPTAVLANAIRDEWKRPAELKAAEMPLFVLACTAFDRVAIARTEIVKELCEYLHTDLVCYRTGMPPELAKRQEIEWGTVTNWISETYGVEPVLTTSLAAISQPAPLALKIEQCLAAMNVHALTVLQSMAADIGSVMVALMLVHHELSVDEAVNIRFLEEDHNASIGGIDEHGDDPLTTAARNALRVELTNAMRYLDLATQAE